MLNGLMGLGGSIARTLVLRGLELLDGRSVEFIVVQRNQTFVICQVQRLQEVQCSTSLMTLVGPLQEPWGFWMLQVSFE